MTKVTMKPMVQSMGTSMRIRPRYMVKIQS